MQESAKQLEKHKPNPTVSAKAVEKTNRFKVMSEEDLVKLETHRQRVATKRNTLRAFKYHDASHLWRAFSHNSTKINIELLNEVRIYHDKVRLLFYAVSATMAI